MNRLLLTSVTSMLLAVVVPGTAAAARHTARRHGARHASVHKHPARRASTVAFSAAPVVGTRPGSTAPPAPGGPPSATDTPSAPSGEAAGKVASFANGVLVLTLGNGSTVEGLVTEATDLECALAAPPPTSSGEDDQGAGDDERGEGEGGVHGSPAAHRQDVGRRSDGAHGEGNEGRDGQGDEGGEGGEEEDGGPPPVSCTAAALVPGAAVREAELRLGSAGAVWEKVELVQ